MADQAPKTGCCHCHAGVQGNARTITRTRVAWNEKVGVVAPKRDVDAETGDVARWF